MSATSSTHSASVDRRRTLIVPLGQYFKALPASSVSVQQDYACSLSARTEKVEDDVSVEVSTAMAE